MSMLRRYAAQPTSKEAFIHLNSFGINAFSAAVCRKSAKEGIYDIINAEMSMLRRYAPQPTSKEAFIHLNSFGIKAFSAPDSRKSNEEGIYDIIICGNIYVAARRRNGELYEQKAFGSFFRRARAVKSYRTGGVGR